MLTLEITRNTSSMDVASLAVVVFTEKTIFAKPLDSKFTNEEKKEILMWRNKLLQALCNSNLKLIK